MTATSGRWRSAARIAFALVCAAWWLQKLGLAHPVGEWDFLVYYHAAVAWRSGLNPYDPSLLPPDLVAQALKFSYPPYALAAFAPFTQLSPLHAMQLFLVAKVAAFGCLLAIWSRLLQTRATDPAWVLFLLFAYSSAIFVDFVAGSVTTFEQLLIWAGVAALLKHRSGVFVASVVAASLFRMTPIVLLIASLMIPDRRLVRPVVAGLVTFALILLATYAVAPVLMTEFLRTIPANAGERGWLNPAAMPLAIDLAAMAARAMHVAPAPIVSTAIYVAIVAAIALPTIAIVRSTAREGGGRLDAMVYAAFLATALVLPRFKNYSYMLLIVPTYFIATRSTQLRRAIPLLILACLPIYSWITTPEHLALLSDYSKWLIALGAWALSLYELHGTAALAPAVERT